MTYQPQPEPDRQYNAPGWQQPTKKKRRPLMWVLTAFAVAAVLCLAGGIAAAVFGGGGSKGTAGPGAQGGGGTEKASGGTKVVMEVTGAKSADITYGLGTDQSQDNGAKLPWKKELSSDELVTIAVIVAQNKGSGEISCKITVDGKTVKENTSKGQYAVVTCQADDLGL